MVDETVVGVDELFFTKKFGLIYENRMYVVSVRYKHDSNGAMNILPLQVAQMADFIVDISDEVVLKQRYRPEYKDKAIGKPINIALDAIEGSFAAIMFAGLHWKSMSPSELIETEPRLKPEFTQGVDNVFGS